MSTFEVTSGQLVCSDPCYLSHLKPNDFEVGLVAGIDVLPGTWKN